MDKTEFGSIKNKLLAVLIASILISILLIGIFSYYSDWGLNILLLVGGVLIINIMLILVSYAFIRKTVTEPLKRIADYSNLLVLGNTDIQIEEGYLKRNDEIGSISRGVINITENMKKQSDAIKRIADGDFSLEPTLRSEKDIIGNSIVSVINVLRNLVLEAENLTAAAVEGNLEIRGNVDQFRGSYREIIGAFNNSMDATVDPLNTAREDLILVERVMDILCDETMKLTEATAAGNLYIRADAGKLEGRYGQILLGFNESLDSLITPLNGMAGYMERIGKGEIPERITEAYQGEFDNIKNSINTCIDGINALVEGQDVRYEMRMNSVIEILNHIADGDLTDLESINESGKRSEYDRVIPCLIHLIETITALYEEINALCHATIDGHLEFRGDAKKFNGQFEKIIEGVNETVDALTAPIAEALTTLREVAKGNLYVSVSGDVKEDHGELKNAINETIKNLLCYIIEISDALSEISEGNLSLATKADYKGDFVKIKDSLDNIIITLSKVMREISVAAEQVATGSRQLSVGCQHLSQRAAEQAGTIQQLSASVAEVADQTKQNAMNANRASELAGSARDLAEKGNSKMREMLNSMTEINDSSSNISRIIKVIDDIAFQTNILALNAAVEAARAGQHGKGFAVVAEEVRSLAARSAAAARETTELIEGSISKVNSGTKIADDTAAALSEIVSSVEEAANLVGGIAKSSNEQALGITQINIGIEQVYQLVQKNSDTAEKGAAGSEELSGQAEHLKEMVDRFKVSKGSIALLTDQSVVH